MFSLSISYNIFDGEELLETSINSVRKIADHISVVYQTTSNFGVKNEKIEPYLKELQAKGLIDKLFLYEPDLIKSESGEVNWKSGTINELEKRQIGLKIAKANGYKIFMNMDADEVYDTKQLFDALSNFVIGDYDSSFCQMKSFYKLPTMELVPPETYYVPLFYKINKNSKLERIENKDYPVICDPTRRMKAGYVRIFNREEIEMYHYSYVRKDIESKVLNSSSQSDEKSKLQVIKHYKNWKSIKDGGLLIGNRKYKLKEVENKFNINI